MVSLLVIVFIATLLYASLATWISSYLRVLAIQGLILCVVTLMELRDFNTTNLVIVFVETLVFKALIVPIFLGRLIRKHNLKDSSESTIAGFYSILIVTLGVVLSFLVANSLAGLDANQTSVKFYTASFSALFTGLFLAMTHKNVLAHLIGFLLLENGIFMLSLVVGGHMPVVVNIGILLDIFTSVLILGIMVGKIATMYNDVEGDQLTQLKD